MRDKIIQIAENFWNIRGSFRIGGVVDIGTHSSLIRRANGKFVFLDAYTFSGEVAGRLDQLTNGGRDVEAVLNLHPFHTVHVKAMHERYPQAAHYGTARHLERFPGLPWQDARTEDAPLHNEFAAEFEFSVPRGVDFISANENVHFSSVLALHRASKTIHVDDTIMYLRLPALMRVFGLKDAVSFHPTLGKALEKRAGAAQDFRDWAKEWLERWRDAENLCTAHTAALKADRNDGVALHARLVRALDKVDKTLRAHERRYG